MSKRKSYKRYSPEFKREALKRASEEGVTDRFTCKELDISERQLRRWRDEYRLLGDEAFRRNGDRFIFRPNMMSPLIRGLAIPGAVTLL